MAKLQKYGLKHHWITAFRMGKLAPFFMAEVSPGEIFKGFSNAVFRLAPMDFPVYMQMRLHAHIFYVPYRLVWDEFPEVFTGEDTTTAWPTITYNVLHDLWPYLGVSPITAQTPSLSALPVRAYNLIWNSHFRNDLLQNERTLDDADGPLPLVHHSSNEYYGSIQTQLQTGTVETVDSSGATIPIPEIRDAFNRQRYAERRAAYGERYEDVLLTEHGIDISDVRLQQPEHCASGSATMGISEVTVTASSTSEEAGEYRGHGITGMNLKFPARKFPEPGLLMGVIYARPRLQLQQRIDKIFLTQDVEDLYRPALVSDTQQIVSSGEVYSEVPSYSNFGYVGKYDHLRTSRDMLAGSTEIRDFMAYKGLSATPTVTFLQQVQELDHIFQDQTSTRMDIRAFFDHKIGKLSPIPRRKK